MTKAQPSTGSSAVAASESDGIVNLGPEALAAMRDRGYSDEVLPLQPDERSWGKLNFITVWMGAVHNILSYMTVAGFFVLGLDVPQVVLAVMLSAVIVSAGYVLNGRSAAKYGIPFAMLLRDSFGVKGSVFPALCRGLIAGVVFLGTTTVVGAEALNVVFNRLIPGYRDLGGGWSLLGLPLPTMISYVILWAITVGLFLGGMKFISVFGKWSSVAIYALIIGAAIWTIDIAGGIGPILSYAPEAKTTSWVTFVACVSALVSNWAGPIVNISDLSRNAKTPSAPAIGLPVGMIVSYVLFAITTVGIIAGTKIAFGEAIFNPVDAFDRIQFTPAVILLILAMVTGGTAFCVFGNLLPSGLQLTALLPRVFTVKTAGVATAVIGTLILPWKLVANTDALFLFYSFIGSMFGPIAGIMLASFYLQRRRRLDYATMYVAPEADGDYRGGYNRLAVGILAFSLVCTMSGAFITGVPLLSALNDFAFFAGLAISFVLYAVLSPLTAGRRG